MLGLITMRLIPIHERDDDKTNPSPSAQGVMPPADLPPETATGAPQDARGAGGIGAVRRPHGIARVPTHTVGHARERRNYARASLALPVRLRSVAGRAEAGIPLLNTQDISSSGIFFLCPKRIEPGTPIEMEVTLVDNPMGRGVVRMRTQACIVRVETAGTPGWHGLAAAFDDITFVRDEPIPTT
jgi:hypothetical protein